MQRGLRVWLWEEWRADGAGLDAETAAVLRGRCVTVVVRDRVLLGRFGGVRLGRAWMEGAGVYIEAAAVLRGRAGARRWCGCGCGRSGTCRASCLRAGRRESRLLGAERGVVAAGLDAATGAVLRGRWVTVLVWGATGLWVRL